MSLGENPLMPQGTCNTSMQMNTAGDPGRESHSGFSCVPGHFSSSFQKGETMNRDESGPCCSGPSLRCSRELVKISLECGAE